MLQEITVSVISFKAEMVAILRLPLDAINFFKVAPLPLRVGRRRPIRRLVTQPLFWSSLKKWNPSLALTCIPV